jgi:small subunit ribosomal protein S21
VQVLVRDNNVDQALKALKKKMQREGIFREMKLARKKLQREGLLPMKPKPVFGAGAGGDRGGRPGGAGAGRGPR